MLIFLDLALYLAEKPAFRLGGKSLAKLVECRFEYAINWHHRLP
jgi:hypothetical protein